MHPALGGRPAGPTPGAPGRSGRSRSGRSRAVATAQGTPAHGGLPPAQRAARSSGRT